MLSDIAIIETRSQAQALDWSLVLISQGIESIIARREMDGAWTLEIAAEDWTRATETIAAYERENATPWRQELKWTGMLFDARAVLWFAALILFHWYVGNSSFDLKSAGVVDRSAILHGEWWRVFTAVTLHGDIAHLAANVTTGIVFLGLAMGCFGAGNAVLLSFLGGALGNVASVATHDTPFYSLGASGMVMASLGLITAHSFSWRQHEKRVIWIGRGAIAGCLLVVLLGVSAKSDVVAHLGGFISGALLGLLATRFRNLLLRRTTNISATFLCVALVIATWWLALNH